MFFYLYFKQLEKPKHFKSKSMAKIVNDKIFAYVCILKITDNDTVSM